jgi:hypothetical protein
MEVFRTKQTVLECFVNHDDCEPKWFKNGKPVKVNKNLLSFFISFEKINAITF